MKRTVRNMDDKRDEPKDSLPERSLLVLFSYHHKNTEKIARVFADVLDAEIKAPQQVNPEELREYSLTGFGSGIYDGKHHQSLLDLADNLPQVSNKKAFIFSTCGIPVAVAGREYIEGYAATSHAPLRERLQSKGYTIAGEFICAGFNTNSFLKLFGGVNKGKPDAGDLNRAEEFARNLLKSAREER